jgi:hypothetical protein
MSGWEGKLAVKNCSAVNNFLGLEGAIHHFQRGPNVPQEEIFYGPQYVSNDLSHHPTSYIFISCAE